MSGRAVWRRRPDDPKTSLGWLVADRERTLRGPRQSFGLLGMLLAVVALASGFPFLAFGLFAAAMMLPQIGRKADSIECLLTLPLPAPAYPCDIEVTREGTTVGTDRGVVTFLDGWLHYEGLRTSFSLSRSDVGARDRGELTLKAGGGVRLYPDANFEWEGVERQGRQARFLRKLDEWYRLDPAVKGRSVLPPLTVHRSGLVRAWSDCAYGGLGAALAVGCVLWAVQTGPLWLGFVGVFVGHGIFQAVPSLKRVSAFVREERRALANETRNSGGH